MQRIRVVQADHRDPRLVSFLNWERSWPSVVVGNETARARQLSFILRSLDSMQRAWPSFSFRELAWRRHKGALLGRGEYRALLARTRQRVMAGLASVGAGRIHVPATDQLLAKRLNKGPGVADVTNCADRAIVRTDTLVEDYGAQLDDDMIGTAVPAPTPFRRHVADPLQLVLLLSSPLTAGEERLMAHYLEMEGPPETGWEATVVVEDPRAWESLRHSLPAHPPAEKTEWLPSLPEPLRPNAKVRVGHIAWMPTGLDAHLKQIVSLLVRVIRCGGTPSDLKIVVGDGVTAASVKQSLIELGVPVQCSESYFLLMNFLSLDLMSMLAAYEGTGRLQGVARLIHLLPHAGGDYLEPLLDFFDEGGGPDTVVGLLREPALRDALRKLAPLRDVTGRGPVSALEEALKCHDQLLDVETSAAKRVWVRALQRWGMRFPSVAAMLEKFWQWRAALYNWSGYKPGSGVAVMDCLPKGEDGLVVLLLPKALIPEQGLRRTVGRDVFLAEIEESQA